MVVQPKTEKENCTCEFEMESSKLEWNDKMETRAPEEQKVEEEKE